MVREVKTMDLKGMQKMWSEMDPDTVKFIFNLFDADGNGRIDTQEFVMAVRRSRTRRASAVESLSLLTVGATSCRLRCSRRTARRPSNSSTRAS